MSIWWIALGIAAAQDQTPEPIAPPTSPFPIVAEIESIGGEGSTIMLIDVGADGRPTQCTIARGSGSIDLDRRACEIVSERGRFASRRDARTGSPVAFQITQRIVWRIEE